MRLFLAEGGRAGFALKGDDIVSVFNNDPSLKRVAHAMLPLAAQLGGRRLDAFDTVLPVFYAEHGFKAASRTSWSDSYAPDNWDKQTFGEFNNGEPDVVFMAYDPAYAGVYSKDDGKRVEDYDEAVALQQQMVDEAAAGEVKASKASAPVAVAPKRSTARTLDQNVLDWARQVAQRRAQIPVMPLIPRPGPVLNLVGIYRPILIDIEHAGHILQTHPEITPEDLAALPSLLQHPRAVLTHKDGGLRLILDSRTDDGRPLLAALNRDKVKDGPNTYKVTEVSTLFGLEDSARVIITDLKAGKVKYLPQKEIARVQEMLLGAQSAISEGLPSTTPDPLSGASIAPSAAAVTRGDPVRVVKVLSDPALVKFRENNAQVERVDSPNHNYSTFKPVSPELYKVSAQIRHLKLMPTPAPHSLTLEELDLRLRRGASSEPYVLVCWPTRPYLVVRTAENLALTAEPVSTGQGSTITSTCDRQALQDAVMAPRRRRKPWH